MTIFNPLGIPVLQVPSVEEITSGRTRIDALRPVAIEELLGPGIAGQVVLVSGAGGSIGAELCRQILALRPRRLVLLERSEPSLYGIDQELRRSLPAGVELVIQAAVLARGGDLFLLDMGEPVRILDLAKQMVRLSGLSLRDAQHPEGDIEIVCTGLRPGEKLYEELLIDAESEPTSHPLIFRATERAIPPEQLWPQIEAMEAAIRCQDAHAALDLLAQLVPEWQRGEVGGQPQSAHPVEVAQD
ncbi:polysaccharide biosynthesis protein [Cyanobium sp. A1C-AMD]|uniref:polysaccharide biosynthesis protein n=1 Tax=Cyanobium sp. A1C-AMD TaxID=2823694 RepID=UPI0021BCD0F0|nr:polysaccharide biosynthesis protein [Cyanobium sp. A1C-AMD]